MKLTALALSLALATSAIAQDSTKAAAPHGPALPMRTFHLHHAASAGEQNEILTALRNMLTPQSKIFLVPSRNEILVEGSPEDTALVEQILAKTDVAAKLYRLTYTLTETDNGKRIGLQHYSLILAAGQRNVLKQGSRVPLVVGSTATTPGKYQGDRTYIDVGINLDSTIESYGPNTVRLQSMVERSSLAPETSPLGAEDPLIRQTKMEGATILTEGKPQSIGTIDIVDSTRRIEVEALVEAIQ